MRIILLLLVFVSTGLLLTWGINATTGLTIKIAGTISTVLCVLGYLMLDLKPKADPTDATIIRLTKGSWYRKKR